MKKITFFVLALLACTIASCSSSSEQKENSNETTAKHYWKDTYVKSFDQLKGVEGSKYSAFWKYPMGASNSVNCEFTLKDGQIDSFSMKYNDEKVEGVTCRIENERFIGSIPGKNEEEFSFDFGFKRYDISGTMNYENNGPSKILVTVVRYDPVSD